METGYIPVVLLLLLGTIQWVHHLLVQYWLINYTGPTIQLSGFLEFHWRHQPWGTCPGAWQFLFTW